MPEWLWSGLQNRLPRFNSGRGLHPIWISDPSLRSARPSREAGLWLDTLTSLAFICWPLAGGGEGANDFHAPAVERFRAPRISLSSRPPSPSPRAWPAQYEAQPEIMPVAPHCFCESACCESVRAFRDQRNPEPDMFHAAVEGDQPIARLLRCTALRSKNSAWLTRAEIVDC